MNYLGHSIVDEVGGGGGSTNIANALDQDVVAMQTVLSNFQPAVSLNPYRFSNGLQQQFHFIDINAPQAIVISGNGSLTSYHNAMFKLNYRGTYKFHVLSRWFSSVFGVGTPINSFRFGVYIGSTLVLPMDFLQFTNNRNQEAPMYIDISGTIDVLDDPTLGTTTVQTSLRYILYNTGPGSFLNIGYNDQTTVVDMVDPANRDYQMKFTILKTGGGDPQYNEVYLTRLVGTLNCIYSDPYTG